MKLQSWHRYGTIFGLALFACGGWAQDAPPAQVPTEEPAEEPEEVEPAIRWNEVTLGLWSTSSNRFFRQYGSPPDGFVLQRLSLLHPQTDGSIWARFLYRGDFDGDNYASGRAVTTDGHTIFSGSRLDSRSFVLDWRRPGPSGFIDAEYVVDHDFTTSFGGFFLYRQFAWSTRYPAPREPDRTNNEVVAFGLGARVLGGHAGINVTSRRTADRENLQPTTLQRRYSVNFSRDVTDSLNLEGQASYVRIEQRGLAESGIRGYAVGGSWAVAPDTAFQFQLGRQDFDLPTLQGPSIRKRLLSSARIIQRLPGWSLQLGMRHREVERYRADGSFVDVPKWDTYDARLAGRVGPARVTVRGSWENLLNAAQMQTEDPRQLQWDDRVTVQTKAEIGNETFALYGIYTRRWQQNRQRAVDINWDNFVVGGSYILSDSLNAFAEGSFEAFRASGDVGTGTPLDFYFPDQRSATVGFNWAKDATLSASAGLNFFESGDVRGSQLTLSVRKALGKDHELGLVVAPWRQSDRLYGITDYRTTVASVQYSVRF
jgi:hypothetical protein